MNKTLYCNSLLLGLVLIPIKSQANEQPLNQGIKANTPSLALLEYLAEMEEVDGNLVGPEDISMINCIAQIKEKKEINQSSTARKNSSNVKENIDEADQPEPINTNTTEYAALTQECKPND